MGTVAEALRGRDFVAANLAADLYLATSPSDGDYARYLKALALFYSGKHAEAEKVAASVIEKHPKSLWRHKAGFLLAQTCIQQRKYERAQIIYEEEAHRLLSATIFLRPRRRTAPVP